STDVSTTLNCNNNWQCLISAAAQCQNATGVVSYSNLPSPLIPELLSSGTTKYDIEKSGSSCTLVSSIISTSISISVEERTELLAEGMTNLEIDAQLEMMNGSLKDVINLPTTCISSSSTISSYLSDQKNGLTGDGEFSFSGGLSESTSQSIITTSSGEKLTCTTQ